MATSQNNAPPKQMSPTLDIFQRLSFHIGRAGLASLFILGGINKIGTYSETFSRMESMGLAPAEILLPATIALELGAGLIIALNLKFARHLALVLAVYTLVVNGFFHRFWELEHPLRALELSLFFKNVSVSGALLMFAALRDPKNTAQEGPHS